GGGGGVSGGGSSGGGSSGSGGGSGGGGGGTSSFAGNFKSTNGHGTALGLLDASGTTSVGTGYSGGVLKNGMFTASVGGARIAIPVTPGATTTFGSSGTASPLGPVTGTSTLSADGRFLYANLTPVNQPTQREFVYGGLPVDKSFYNPTATNQITAFALHPDAALGSAVPFVTNATGGNIAKPSVSPLYVAAPANTQFGAFNSATNPNVTAPHWLQASLGIEGSRGSQNSALVVSTGSFFTSSDTKTVVGSGPVRGSFMAGGSSNLPTRIGSGASTVSDPAGNNLFGTNKISGFVLDQNQYNATQNFVPALASQNNFGKPAVNYAFNQPATATSLPAGTGSSRTTQTLSGWFGGVMYSTATSPYAEAGMAQVFTDAASNRVQANFTGSNPLASSSSGATPVSINFGSLTGNGRGRSAFIDDSRFAALESPTLPSQINGVSTPPGLVSGQPGTRVAMVSSGTVPQNPLLPATGLCQCQFLQWGYWTGDLDTPNSAGTGIARIDRAHINGWVAGAPTPGADILALQRASGSAAIGNYTGNMFGSVVNNGTSYLASGGLKASYNFATRAGSFSVINYDHLSFTTKGTVPLSGANYTFGISQPGLAGKINGTFYGPMAAETGGTFAFGKTVGPSYLTSGVFAAKR
ncbi:MAG TPA: hypothetical protein VGF07_05445, partial [Stellaceae bacterium]